jgi:hypothetical protein
MLLLRLDITGLEVAMNLGLLVALAVAVFGIVAYLLIPAILAEIESERTDLARDVSRCGLHSRP